MHGSVKEHFLRPRIHELIVEVFRFVIEPYTRILFEFEKKPTRSKAELEAIALVTDFEPNTKCHTA